MDTGLSSRDAMQLAPMPDSYDLDRGLLLAVQAIQVSAVEMVGQFVVPCTIGCLKLSCHVTLKTFDGQ